MVYRREGRPPPAGPTGCSCPSRLLLEAKCDELEPGLAIECRFRRWRYRSENLRLARQEPVMAG